MRWLSMVVQVYFFFGYSIYACRRRRQGAHWSHCELGGPASERADDLRELARLAESGVLKPVIDRTYGFQQIPEAHAYVETGRKRGSVVVPCRTTD